MQIPVTAFYASLLALLFFYLTVRVIQGRRSKKIGIGDNNDKALNRLIRAHGNFAEYTPIIVVLMLIAELNQVHHLYLHVIGTSLMLGRVLHAIGLSRHGGTSWQRMIGMILTFIALLGIAGLNLLVLYQPV